VRPISASLDSDASPEELGRRFAHGQLDDDREGDRVDDDHEADRRVRFRATGEGYAYVTDRPAREERPAYLHRLTAVAWGILDGLDDPRHVHHETPIPWLNTEENLTAESPENHAEHHLKHL